MMPSGMFCDVFHPLKPFSIDMIANRAMFTEKDLTQIQSRGSDLATVEQQVKNFETGFPYLEIIKAATVNDGILRLNEAAIAQAVARYESQLGEKKTVKFVPASGAASRMFKALFSFMESYDGSEEAKQAFETQKGPVHEFFERLEDFAFYDSLDATFGEESLAELKAQGEYVRILKHLLTDEGLGYGQLPKGLLEFHAYDDGSRTPMEEHLVEAANYATRQGGIGYLHFTVSPEHRDRFEELVKDQKSHYETLYGVKLAVSFSEQKPATDTIAVDMENRPFREDDDSLLFRPGGHGALIENLNDIQADIVFIKNIDNVVPDRLKPTTYTYKKAIAGVLLEFQEKIFSYLKALQQPSMELLLEVETFMKETLCFLPAPAYADMDQAGKAAYLREKLHRPIRVCGMVKNEGEPGGGPFWVKNSDGSISLQIVESAQIDTDNPDQKAIMQNATHFNPVDLVCAHQDHTGEDFDLLRYRDPSTGFIAYKSKSGRDLKAQELPGLWNGAMAQWNTIFMEVPIETFNPVKTVNDLLREQHQK